MPQVEEQLAYLAAKRAEIEEMGARIQVEEATVDTSRRLQGGGAAASLAWLASHDLAAWPETDEAVAVAYEVNATALDGGGSLDWLAKMPLAEWDLAPPPRFPFTDEYPSEEQPVIVPQVVAASEEESLPSAAEPQPVEPGPETQDTGTSAKLRRSALVLRAAVRTKQAARRSKGKKSRQKAKPVEHTVKVPNPEPIETVGDVPASFVGEAGN
eukprot:SAG31_NODE_3028_length_4768_cov_5.420433_1_plen_213_part_00